MPTNIKREFGRSDADLSRAEDFARNIGGGETDGAVHVLEVFDDHLPTGPAEENLGVIWVMSSDQLDAFAADGPHFQELGCFGFDEGDLEDEEGVR